MLQRWRAEYFTWVCWISSSCDRTTWWCCEGRVLLVYSIISYTSWQYLCHFFKKNCEAICNERGILRNDLPECNAVCLNASTCLFSVFFEKWWNGLIILLDVHAITFGHFLSKFNDFLAISLVQQYQKWWIDMLVLPQAIQCTTLHDYITYIIIYCLVLIQLAT